MKTETKSVVLSRALTLGVGGGMGLYNTPTVVESVMSATLPVVAELPVLLVDLPPAILLATGGG